MLNPRDFTDCDADLAACQADPVCGPCITTGGQAQDRPAAQTCDAIAAYVTKTFPVACTDNLAMQQLLGCYQGEKACCCS